MEIQIIQNSALWYINCDTFVLLLVMALSGGMSKAELSDTQKPVVNLNPGRRIV